MDCETPIISLKQEIDSVQIYMKREDLLPFSFGGNKVRIAQEYYMDMKKNGKNCMIGYGNARSNLCRVLSNLCFSKKEVCHIISPSDDNGDRIDTNNSLIVESCNAIFHTCTKENVAETVESVLDECLDKGYKPYYIYGDKYGKGNEAVPVRAYVKVYAEIKKQLQQLNKKIDYIFIPTGTGMTQAGLIMGQSIYGGDEKIIGISVARTKEQEETVIRNYIKCFCEDINIGIPNKENIYLSDDYICGGYGKFDENIVNTINDMIKINGIALDPTYTGKAYYGMKDYIEKHNIKNKNILFIHTGGLPLFFDNIELLLKK